MKVKLAIAKRIRELRCHSRYSQNFVADKLFISQAAYSRIETGQNSIAVDHVVRLSRLYSITTDFLLLGESGYGHISNISQEEGTQMVAENTLP